MTVWFGYFPLFIVATGCPSERRPQKTVTVVMGDSARYRTKLLRIPSGSLTFFNRHTGPRFNVSSERQLVIFSCPAGDSNPQPAVTRNIVFTSHTLYLPSKSAGYCVTVLYAKLVKELGGAVSSFVLYPCTIPRNN